METKLVSERLNSFGKPWGGGRDWVKHCGELEKVIVENAVLRGYRIFVQSFLKPTRSYFDL